MNIIELSGIVIFIGIVFTVLWLYVCHRIWQKSKILESTSPFEQTMQPTSRSHLANQQYPNQYVFPRLPLSLSYAERLQQNNNEFMRRYQNRMRSRHSDGPNSVRPPPSIVVFTLSIPEEEEEEDLPPSYEQAVQSQTPKLVTNHI